LTRINLCPISSNRVFPTSLRERSSGPARSLHPAGECRRGRRLMRGLPDLAEIEGLQRKIERWRQKRPKSQSMPEELWREAGGGQKARYRPCGAWVCGEAAAIRTAFPAPVPQFPLDLPGMQLAVLSLTAAYLTWTQGSWCASATACSCQGMSGVTARLRRRSRPPPKSVPAGPVRRRTRFLSNRTEPRLCSPPGVPEETSHLEP
jgi:hypothetical protein